MFTGPSVELHQPDFRSGGRFSHYILVNRAPLGQVVRLQHRRVNALNLLQPYFEGLQVVFANVLVFLFLKYITDVWDERYEDAKARYGEDDDRIRRRMARERFIFEKCKKPFRHNDAGGSYGGSIRPEDEHR